MKSTTLNQAIAILAAVTSLITVTQANAEQALIPTPVSTVTTIETADLTPTLEQRRALTESLWSEALSSCDYCTTTSEFETTELGKVEVAKVIGTTPNDTSNRFAVMRMRQFSTFNALETHL